MMVLMMAGKVMEQPLVLKHLEALMEQMMDLKRDGRPMVIVDDTGKALSSLLLIN